MKKIRTVKVENEVKQNQSRPRKSTGLSKSDPEYYSKIGKISAEKRKMTSEQFSEMAKKSHLNRTSYNGGRKKKEVEEQKP